MSSVLFETPGALTAICALAADELARRQRALSNAQGMSLELTVVDAFRPRKRLTIGWELNDQEAHGQWQELRKGGRCREADSEPLQGGHPGIDRWAALEAIYAAARRELAAAGVRGIGLRKVSEAAFEMGLTDGGRQIESYRLEWTADGGPLLVKRNDS